VAGRSRDQSDRRLRTSVHGLRLVDASARLGDRERISVNAQPGERSNGQLLDRGLKSRQRDADCAHGSRSLFIVPTRRGDGLMASIRGRMIELEDPTDDPSGPTSDEILILSIASDLAWYAHRFFRGRGLAADVNITALWQTVDDPPRLADVS